MLYGFVTSNLDFVKSLFGMQSDDYGYYDMSDYYSDGMYGDDYYMGGGDGMVEDGSYTDGAEAEPTVSVPSFAGMTPQQVLSTASTYGLNVELKGIHKDDYSCHASTQSIEPGTMVTTGTIVSVQFIYNESIE